ncbi:hypothetical protein MUK42_01176 [Musa troglodytarum]|uniref:Uncharacterized protein n=1 Tax=Musa troglodytarum TaxID=320322 RepID=A0A9E7FX11_9LILI|nr:hypothetical protein MUK42_01176 [Musa troglodytarum]
MLNQEFQHTILWTFCLPQHNSSPAVHVTSIVCRHGIAVFFVYQQLHSGICDPYEVEQIGVTTQKLHRTVTAELLPDVRSILIPFVVA